jgi:predicted component of type VI protein secretion system
MENMKKLSILSCVLLLVIALLAPGCKKKEDASDKEQKLEVKVSAEETVKASEEKAEEVSTEKVAEASEEK